MKRMVDFRYNLPQVVKPFNLNDALSDLLQCDSDLRAPESIILDPNYEPNLVEVQSGLQS